MRVPFSVRVCVPHPFGHYMIPANKKTNLTLNLEKVNINLDLDRRESVASGDK